MKKGPKQQGRRKVSPVNRPLKTASGKLPPDAKLGMTGRKQAEQETAERGVLLQQIMDTASVAIFLVDKAGRITHANRRMTEMFGCAMAELIGSEYVAHVHPKERDISRRKMLALLASEMPSVDLERHYQRKDGTEFLGHLAGRRFHDDQGRDIGLIGVITDITERKRAEEKLRESEAELREAQQIARIGSWRYEVRADRLQWSDELYSIFGITPADGPLSTQLLFERVHPEDRETLQRQVASGLPHRSDYRIVMRDGLVKHIHEEVRVEQNAQGKPVRMYGTAQDVTERKQTEEALRQSKEILEKTFHSMDSAIFILDKSSPPLITDCNPAATGIFGFAKEELLGQATRFLHVNGDSLVEFQKINYAAIEKQGFLSSFEYRMKRKNGEIFPSEHSVFPLRDDHGDRIGWVSVVKDITERKRAEEKLRESETRLNTILENVGAYIFIKDAQYRYTYVNRKVSELLGVPAERILGRSDDEFFSKASVEEIMRSDRPVIERGETVAREETELAASNDLPRTYWTVKLPLRDGGGAITGLCGISTDITEHKRDEVALRNSERMLQTIIDTEPDCIKILDGESRLVMMNRAGLDMLQVDTLEQVKGQSVCPIIAPGYQQAFSDLTQRVFQGGSGSLEFQMVGMRGRKLWLETHAVPLRNEKDEIAALLGVTRDITERKRVEEVLKESERSLTTLMGNLPGMAYRCRNDREWTMEYVSEGAAALTGYQPEDLIRNATIAYNDLIHPDDRVPVWDSVQKAVERRQKYTLNYRIRTAEAREKWVWEQGQGVFSAGGDLLALEGFIIDVSERRLLEEERLKAQKLESIGTLAGGIAHDFNNLLQGVFGYISMAKLTLDQREKSLAMLEQAEQALHRAVGLTSQLLTFSKGGKPVKKAMELRPVIESACRFSLSGSRTDCRLAAEDGLWRVEADEGQIGQVIQNIVLNADQAMPLGGTIEITARNRPASAGDRRARPVPGDCVEVVIRDSGVGIPAEYLPKIFDPYFTTKEKGSGLGLATSYSIIRNHGGALSVSSEQGKGSTFTITLPAAAPVPESPLSAATPVSTRSGRVLVMDDEEVVRQVAEVLIRELGHDVECTEHGDAAIERYRRAMAEGRPFDVVILDLTIRGGKGGAETLRELLEIDPGVKAVVSSGYAADEVIATYRQHGFCSFLKKPYVLLDLAKVLNEVMT